MKGTLEGANELTNEIAKIIRSINTKNENSPLRKAVEEYAQGGADAWSDAYENEKRDDMLSNVDVWYGWKDNANAQIIYVRSRKLYFIEFGTGVLNNSGSDEGRYRNAYPGSWSSGANNKFARGGERGKKWLVEPKLSKYGGRWILPVGTVTDVGKNKWATGHKPANGMMHCMKKLSSKKFFEECFKGVFK